MVLSVIQGEFLDILYVQCFRNRINWFISFKHIMFKNKNNIKIGERKYLFHTQKQLASNGKLWYYLNKERHFAVLRLASIDWKSLRTKPAYSGANTWRAIFLFVYLFFVCDEGAE